MKLYFITILLSISLMTSFAQSELPYYEIPEAPTTYNAGTVAARMIDGLGFRFYWATESINEADLSYKPSSEARTYYETIEHIYGMTKMIVNSAKGVVNERSKESLSFEEMRVNALYNLKEASDVLKTSDNLEEMTIKYQGEDGLIEYPFWIHLNGPISDCIWHTGQLVSMRRASGNPINSKVSFFTGKVRE